MLRKHARPSLICCNCVPAALISSLASRHVYWSVTQEVLKYALAFGVVCLFEPASVPLRPFLKPECSWWLSSDNAYAALLATIVLSKSGGGLSRLKPKSTAALTVQSWRASPSHSHKIRFKKHIASRLPTKANARLTFRNSTYEHRISAWTRLHNVK